MTIGQRQLFINEDELFGYLDAMPSDQVAFLPAETPTSTVAETLAAMANANGGVVLLGVDPSGAIQMDMDANAVQDAAAQAGLLTDPPLVLPSPRLMPSARGVVVAVQVPPGLPHIYSLRGLFLTRTLGQNRTLSTPELRSLLLERGDAGFEAQLVSGATLADLDEQRVQQYLDRVSYAPAEEIHQALLARGCASYNEQSRDQENGQLIPTAAGMLLFGRYPQRFLRSAEIICVRYKDEVMADEFVRQDIGGCLADQIRQAEAFVVGNMRRGMKIRGFAREETSEYPLGVVREAIVNAVAHRDYSIRGDGIRLFMFSNRLEVYSPGRLPGHVTLDNLKDERYSRNEAVVAVLSDMGYIERLGYGIDRMLATMAEFGLPSPKFEETSAGFKVTLQSGSPDLVSSEPAQQPSAYLFLSERQAQAMAYVRAKGRITNSDYLALAPDVSAETIRRDLADLVEKNLLLRIGEKRATYYILK